MRRNIRAIWTINWGFDKIYLKNKYKIIWNTNQFIELEISVENGVYKYTILNLNIQDAGTITEIINKIKQIEDLSTQALTEIGLLEKSKMATSFKDQPAIGKTDNMQNIRNSQKYKTNTTYK